MKWLYLSSYFISNYVLILIYVIFKLYVENYSNDRRFYLNNTTEKESHIMFSFLTLILLRYIRYYTNFSMFIHDFLFYSKLAIFSVFIFINYKYAVWYLALILIFRIAFTIPKYKGATKLIDVISEGVFDSLININDKTKKNEYTFAVFYSNMSSKCIFTEELWATLSLKYTIPRLKFIKINVDELEHLASKNNIDIRSFYIDLPVLVMYKNGCEIKRYPPKDKNGKPTQAKFYLKRELIIYFEFERIYSEILSNK